MIERKDRKEPKRRPEEIQIFSARKFYIEISHHRDIENHATIQKAWLNWPEKQTIHWWRLKTSIILKPDDAMAQDILVAIQTNCRNGRRQSPDDETGRLLHEIRRGNGKTV